MENCLNCQREPWSPIYQSNHLGIKYEEKAEPNDPALNA